MTSERAATPATWMAGALLYSGRPDPSWVVGGDATALIRQFDDLEPWRGPLPDQSRLGYRGVWLRAPDGRRWIVHAGVAWIEGTSDIRADGGRRFERALLATAAVGVLPDELRESLAR
jgi:hypothetical protein